MPNFKYRGKNIKGETLKGKLEAGSEKEAILLLRRQNIYPIEIKKESIANKEISFSIFQKVKIKDLAVFCRQFHAILDAGISVLESLDILRNQTENKKLRDAIDDIYEEVQKGKSLSSAMANYKSIFPEILINMIETGEVSGQLDVVLERMAVHFEKENKINQKIQGAMVYPAIISIVALLVVWFLMTFVLPNFVDMFKGFGITLPLPTRILLGTGKWLKNYWYILFAIIVALIYIFRKYSNTEKGRYRIDKLKLKLPVIGKVSGKIATSRFARTLSTLLASGISIIEAMEIVIRIIGNSVISEGIHKSMDNIKKGLGIAEPLKELGIFPPMLISMIRIGEESGSLDSMLAKTADFYDEEVESAVAKMTTLIEPLIIVILAFVVGAIVVSIVLPMFEMFNQIGV
ncbi:MAG: type pilus assembly protein PilC [Candidatus Petromonas sp.]|jgi:type IV pilus assembly protein PilC|nr:type pilus assembly protein PilC [Candidatus Petromonas sp.]